MKHLKISTERKKVMETTIAMVATLAFIILLGLTSFVP